MKIGILQTGYVAEALAKEHGQYPAMFQTLLAEHSFDFATWDVLAGEMPDAPQDADGWLITGSKYGAYDDLPWIAPLEAFIRTVMVADRPLVGVCFGHQIIAQAMGGRVEKFDGGWAVGPQDYDFGDKTMTVHAWHQDQVTQRPLGANVVARNAFCENAALVYGRQAYTVQPHPEIADPYAAGLIDVRGPGVVPDADLAAAKARLGTPLDAAAMAAQFARFYRERQLA